MDTRRAARVQSASTPGHAALARAARTGDANALGSLYDAYADLLYRTAFRLSGSRDDAQDVVHDCFVGLPEALRHYDERGRLDAWMRRIVVRLVLMRRRGHERLREVSYDATPSTTGWDLSVVRAMRTAAFSAGDSATAWSMTARLVVDPSTSDSVRDSLAMLGTRALGAERWSTVREDAAHLFSQRMLETSITKSLAGSPRLRDAQGQTHTLREVGAGRVTVVALWSRSCGWALDDLDNLADVAKRLEKVGSRLVIVIDDEPGPSAELSALLAQHKVDAQPYFDIDHSTSHAFTTGRRRRTMCSMRMAGGGSMACIMLASTASARGFLAENEFLV